MKKLLLTGMLLCFMVTLGYAQSNNPLSIYEGEQINSVRFFYENLPQDTIGLQNFKSKIVSTFKLYPQTQYTSLLASYYVSQINLFPFVEKAKLDINISSEGGVDLMIYVNLKPEVSGALKTQNVFKDFSTFPVMYNSQRVFVTLKFSSSEMAYSNGNAWFAQPLIVNNGNPLAVDPVGEGYTGWVEGFANAGLYSVFNVVPKINLHVYGGASYLASFSAGRELFTGQSRFYGDVEEAFAGLVGGGRSTNGHVYRYHALFGRKQFVLGDGWLVINTAMNGGNKAALQLNPRWACKQVIEGGFAWDRIFIQLFQLQVNELPILKSNTVLNGVNLELGNKDQFLIGASFLQVPKSHFNYYLPDGTVHSRKGLQVYNLRVFKNSLPGVGGLFFKTEGGFQRNSNFDMKAWAYYGELGWNFVRTCTKPTVSYRFAYFSGDNPDSKSYNRWDALYTGGTGEQWVQGSNMYKMVQNSNELTHRLQAVMSPVRKIQLVGQAWLFYAASKNNLGGNPALSIMQSYFYGSEFNLTIKYFHSRSWYFHINTAYTIPGGAIKDNVPDTKNWYCLSAFARYSF